MGCSPTSSPLSYYKKKIKSPQESFDAKWPSSSSPRCRPLAAAAAQEHGRSESHPSRVIQRRAAPWLFRPPRHPTAPRPPRPLQRPPGRAPGGDGACAKWQLAAAMALHPSTGGKRRCSPDQPPSTGGGRASTVQTASRSSSVRLMKLPVLKHVRLLRSASADSSFCGVPRLAGVSCREKERVGRQR